MNNMIRLKDKLINKNYIFYIEEQVEFCNLLFVSSCLDRCIISYDNKEELLKDIKKLKQIGFKEIEYYLINLDNVICIEPYKNEIKEKDFIQITFCNKFSQPLVLELDEPEDIIDDIMLRVKILEKELLEYAYSNM